MLPSLCGVVAGVVVFCCMANRLGDVLTGGGGGLADDGYGDGDRARGGSGDASRVIARFEP